MNIDGLVEKGNIRLVQKIRIVIAWIFYISAWVIAASYFTFILYLAFVYYGPSGFYYHFPPPADGFLFFSPLLIYFILSSISRIISWTSPFEKLPRFRDINQQCDKSEWQDY